MESLFLNKNYIYLRCFDIHICSEMIAIYRSNSSIFQNVMELSWKGPLHNMPTFTLFGSQ